MADQDNTNRIKVVSKVSDPPTLSATDVVKIQQESQRLREAFSARTASMEILTVDDLNGRRSETAPTWLDDIYSLVAKAMPDDAVDILYQRFDEMFTRLQFELCDGVLRAIDLSRLDTNLLVALLAITRPASGRLSEREATLNNVERELRKRVPERAERLLAGLR